MCCCLHCDPRDRYYVEICALGVGVSVTGATFLFERYFDLVVRAVGEVHSGHKDLGPR